jgi:hypothetical protein
MRPQTLILLSLIAIVALILLITSPWDSGGADQNKAGLLTSIGAVLEQNEAPNQYTRCFLGILQKNLTEEEVRASYEEMPSSAGNQGGIAVLNYPSAASQKVSQAGLLCAQRLIQSGDYTPVQVAHMLRGLRG